MLVDTHAHLNFPQFKGDEKATIRRARKAGVGIIVNVGTNLKVSRSALDLARPHEGVYATVGFHPHDVELADADGLKALKRLASGNGKVVAVGETGLDFFRNYAPRPLQERIFRFHIRLARQTGLPLVIHSRGAEDRVMDILESEGGVAAGGTLHCFGGCPHQARRAVDLGFHLGFGGTVTYNRSTSLTVALETPPDRILLETDCPYLAPVPHRGRRNEPAYVRQIAEFLAGRANEPLDSFAARTTENARRLFGLT
ncbi:MAG: TatD family hydrolase [Gemmatimonadota bacterium]|nr:TatD family hydrolase [Gemmatimonadota bacterium]